jgi:hypothetical protein
LGQGLSLTNVALIGFSDARVAAPVAQASESNIAYDATSARVSRSLSQQRRARTLYKALLGAYTGGLAFSNGDA